MGVDCGNHADWPQVCVSHSYLLSGEPRSDTAVCDGADD